MKLTIKATNFKITPAVYQYIDDKLNRDLEKYVSRQDTSIEGWVEIGRTTRHHRSGQVFRAEMQIRMPGKKTIRAESEDLSLHIAIDKVKDDLQRELKKYKDRQSAEYKRGARKTKKDLRLAPEARFYRKGRIREEGI